MFKLPIFFQFTSNATTFLCNQHLQNWQKMKLVRWPFLQPTQESLISIVTFPAFSLLIINFVFLTFIPNPFDLNVPMYWILKKVPYIRKSFISTVIFLS